MKKLFVLFILVLSCSLFAQTRIVYKSVGTLTEATTKTVYVPLGNDWSRIDSVSLTLAGTGEIDVDSVNCYLGWTGQSGAYYGTTAYTFLCDPNIAASTKFWTNGVGATADKDDATVLTSAVMRHGINILKVTVAGADGCDATDPNELILIFSIWGVKNN